MKDVDARKGIHDPWRMHSPDREAAPDDKPVGSAGSSHPLDVDLLPHTEYVFRHMRSTGDLLVHGADEATGAADMLAAVLDALPKVKVELQQDGITVVDAKDVTGRRGFFIKGTSRAVCVSDVAGVAEGLSRLVRSLRTSQYRRQLERAGVIPLIK